MKEHEPWGSAIKPLLILAVIFAAVLWLFCFFSPDPTSPEQEWRVKHDREMRELRKQFNGE
jgi:hypothetical protein